MRREGSPLVRSSGTGTAADGGASPLAWPVGCIGRNRNVQCLMLNVQLNIENCALVRLGTGALLFGACPRLRGIGTGTAADGGASPLAWPAG